MFTADMQENRFINTYTLLTRYNRDTEDFILKYDETLFY